MLCPRRRGNQYYGESIRKDLKLWLVLGASLVKLWSVKGDWTQIWSVKGAGLKYGPLRVTGL